MIRELKLKTFEEPEEIIEWVKNMTKPIGIVSVCCNSMYQEGYSVFYYEL